MRRNLAFGFLAAVLMIFLESASGEAADIETFTCHICTCANQEVVCIQQEIMDDLEELGICGAACSSIGSSYGSRQTVQTPCSEILACTARQRQAPAAGPFWLSLAALGMAVLGGLALRRARYRA